MAIWPFQPPQSFEVPLIKRNGNDNEDANEEILQMLPLPQSNCIIVLTETRVFVYNFKPMALIACHVRSEGSLSELGPNQFVISDTMSGELFEGLISEEALNGLGVHHGKIALYVVTKLNFLMVYQILLTANPSTVFKEFGIPISNLYEIDTEGDRGIMEENDDDEILTVFDKNDSHKVIQNGYVIDKQQGFLHFLNKSPEAMDELPIKRVELRLKIILKFDHNIIDIFAAREANLEEDNEDSQHLLILFPHGLQLINLKNFKLESNSLVKVSDGQKLFEYKGKLHVLSQTTEKTLICEVDFVSMSITPTTINTDCKDEILNVFSIDDLLVFAYGTHLLYYDIKNEAAVKIWKSPYKIKQCDLLTQDTVVLLSSSGDLEILTKWANYLFSTSDNDLDVKSFYSNFSSFSMLDNCLLTSTKTGQFFKLDLWQEASSTISDFRYPNTFILHNNNNDIMIYSPSQDSSTIVNFQVIKLPTKTINNLVTHIKMNGMLTMLAALVANKNILLIHILKSNTWHSFSDVNIIDMTWLGNEYLFCRTLEDNRNEFLRCYHFPLARLTKPEITDYLMWDYAVPSGTKIMSMHVNTLTRYKMLKIKSKGTNDDNIDNVFKTAEIIIACADDEIRTIDVLSNVNANGVNTVKRFHPLPVQKLPIDLVESFEWVMSFKEGYMAFGNSQFLKIEKLEDDTWQCTTLLKDVEKILDLVVEDVFIVRENSIELYSLDDLWLDKASTAIIPISDNDYPVAVSPETAVIHSMHSIFREKYSKLVIHQTIYLDQLIDHSLSLQMSNIEIDAKYHSLKHYKFTLEKVLSAKVLNNEPLTTLLDLINIYDQGFKSSGKLEIISNCLRKIEVEHWDYLFTKLNLTPRDLLMQCVEQNEARVLGILLMVFLNYDCMKSNVSELKNTVNDADAGKTNSNLNNKKKGKKGKKKKAQKQTNNGFVSKVLDDEDLILQVLRILVNTAASSAVAEEAQEFWDMSFQLVRFIHALESEGELI